MKNNGFTVVETETKTVRAAKSALKSCLNIIKQRISFLGSAVNVFEPVAVKENTGLITDGKHLFFHAETILEEYKIYGIHYLIKMLLHMVLHGVFGDFELQEEKEWMSLRSAVMDLRVDRMTELLDYGTDRELYQGIMYRPGLYLLGRRNKREQKNIIKNSTYCRLDDHRLWMKQRKYKTENSQSETDVTKEELEKLWGAVRAKLGMARNSDTGEDSKNSLLGRLSQMAQGHRGDSSGEPGRLGKAAGEQGRDYAGVLRTLCQPAEVVKEEDTLDANLYLYGLECYGNVALVEPMEVSEKAQMNTLVLAVDTSGSCVGWIPEFLRETVAVLSQVKDLTGKGSVAYMECDSQITKELFFDTFSDAVDTMKEHYAAGGGGTDFCPVFQQVEKLEKEGRVIDALFYFSDGDGMFPEKKPDYPVYFVMKRVQGLSLCEVPDWVKCIEL